MSEAQRIADEHEILKLANAYSHAVMRCDGRMAARVYAEDGQLVAFGRPPIVGRAALEAAFVATFSPLAFITQTCASHVIDVRGDEAIASFSVNELFRAKGQEDVLMMCLGIYEDQLTRTPQGWRFARRRFSPFFRGTVELKGKLSERPEFEHDLSAWVPFRAA